MAKAVFGTPVNHGDGTFTVVYDTVVENLGNVVLSTLQVADDLSAATTFPVPADLRCRSLTSAESAASASASTAATTAATAESDLLAATDTLGRRPQRARSG